MFATTTSLATLPRTRRLSPRYTNAPHPRSFPPSSPSSKPAPPPSPNHHAPLPPPPHLRCIQHDIGTVQLRAEPAKRTAMFPCRNHLSPECPISAHTPLKSLQIEA